MKQRSPPTRSPTPTSGTQAAPSVGAGNAARAATLDDRLRRAADRARGALPHQARLEATFGVDLGHLRVALGDDETREALAERGAEAMAVGDTLLFADPNPRPELVAHEVTHTLQQARGGTGGGEAEADAGATALSAGTAFDVKGGAEEKPQFSTSTSTRSKGSVKVTMSGAPVSPPAFSDLGAVHDWLMQNQAALASWSGTIKVRFSGTVKQSEQVIWAYYQANQELEIVGADDAVVSGFSGSGSDQTATPGYFLAYRPIIPQASSAANPAAANFSMHGLTVRGFVSGGVEISPRSGQLPTAEAYADASYDPEAGHGDGGITAFVSGASIKGNTFEQMGTKYLTRGEERYAPTDPEGYKYAGYGGIVARGLEYSSITGNTFRDLENRDSKKRSEADGGDVNWLGLMHGVYLRDHSSYDTVANNDFDTISGAPVKLTNASNYDKIRGNTSKNAGKDTFALEHYSTSNPGGAVEEDSLGYSSKGVKKAKDGKKYITGNETGSSYSGYADRELAEYREKKVTK